MAIPDFFRPVVDRVDRVVGREMARIERFHAVGDAVFVDARLDHLHSEFWLMIAVTQIRNDSSGNRFLNRSTNSA